MGEGYAHVLRDLLPGAVVDICYPADAGANLPDRAGLESYDGVAITGSALNVYDGGPAVDSQVALARAVIAARTPVFGSCWGLQVLTVAAGGSVRKNPRGREMIVRRYGNRLVREGFFADPDDLFAYATDLELLDREPGSTRLAWRYGLDGDVLDKDVRRTEIENWIAHQVLPTRAARGRG
jgi:Glutamine amidotransferase class-I